MAVELEHLALAAQGVQPRATWWRDTARLGILSQLLVTGGPLLVGALFPVGVPLYSSMFGELGKYNCGFYLLTHQPCPACGLTSSVVSAMHGQPMLSLAYHPLGLFFTLMFLFGFLGGLLKWRALSKPLPNTKLNAFLVEFPPADWLNWLAIGFIVIYLVRAIRWTIGDYS